MMAKTNPFPLKRSTLLYTYTANKTLISFRLSREEREAAYNKARERIFGKDGEGGATPGLCNSPSDDRIT